MLLDKKFFQSIVNSNDSENPVEVNETSFEEVVPKGENSLSNTQRVQLVGSKNNAEYKYSFIIKTIPESSLLFEKVLPIAFRNEAIAYTEIIPTLERFAVKPIPVAKCLFSNEEIVVLEDLNLSGYKAVNKSIGFTTTELETVIEEMANIHSASIVMHHKEPEKIQNLSEKIHDFVIDEEIVNTNLENFQDQTLDLAISLLHPTTDSKTIDLLKLLKGKFFLKRREILLEQTKFRVINHGDLWANNILLNDKNELKFIDLQLMRFASPAADLSYFFYINIKDAKRQQLRDHLLKLYHNELNQCLRAANVPIPIHLTVDWLSKEIKRFSLFGMSYALICIPLFLNLMDRNAYWERVGSENSANVDISEEHKMRILNLVRTFASESEL